MSPSSHPTYVVPIFEKFVRTPESYLLAAFSGVLSVLAGSLATEISKPKHRHRPPQCSPAPALFRAHRQPPSGSSSSSPGPASVSDEESYLWLDENPSEPDRAWLPAIGSRWQPGHRRCSPSTSTRAPTFIAVDLSPRPSPPYYSCWRRLPRLPIGVAHPLSTARNACELSRESFFARLTLKSGYIAGFDLHWQVVRCWAIPTERLWRFDKYGIKNVRPFYDGGVSKNVHLTNNQPARQSEI
ncbi:hypothetical protein GGX14DRAFT_406114 [Mycena pura]|uniref:Uncharacterized protein n=1 Tax=Mycena pura TaxID=153505 RepID=A0AAD6UUN4_9AGAR|nr:hypothetical protein GGX14DRAFT_406114 [Mycena pura]